MDFNKKSLSKHQAMSLKGRGKAQTSDDGSLKPSTSFVTTSMSKNGSVEADASADIPIKVIARIRPHNKHELRNNNGTVVEVVDDKTLIFDPKEKNIPLLFHNVETLETQESGNTLTEQNKQLRFTFDRIFDSSATNKDIFEGSVKNLIGELLDGYNCTVFTYGAIGAGKTHTMVGNNEDPGITQRFATRLFSEIEKQSEFREFSLDATCLEIFYKNTYNLVGDKYFPLPLREDDRRGVTVGGLKPIAVHNAEELLSLFEEGNKCRAKDECDEKNEFDRSHVAFQVYIKIINKLDGQVKKVKLSMIDLAASKRASITESKGALKDSININISLLALGNCINRLVDGAEHIPYRDSELTRILKDSLGGNCYTIMVANIGPSSLTYQDTYNTLKYANRAKEIRSSAKENVSGETLVAGHIKVDEQTKEELSKSRVAYKNDISHVISEHKPNELTLGIYCKLLKLCTEKKDLIKQILPLDSDDIILAWMLYITLQDEN